MGDEMSAAQTLDDRSAAADSVRPRLRRAFEVLVWTALPLLGVHALWLTATMDTWSFDTPVRWWLLGGSLASLMLCVVGLWAGLRGVVMASISWLLWAALTLWSYKLYPTLGFGGVAALGLEPLVLGPLVLGALLLAPVLFAAYWLRWWLWGPLASLALWCAVPLGWAVVRGIPVEELPQVTGFWDALPVWIQPLPATLFVYGPVAALLSVVAWVVSLWPRDRSDGDAPGGPAEGRRAPAAEVSS